jgi:NAD(P)-dependent dehydrogenase (short-subunit alcohol dehydrogenase family)
MSNTTSVLITGASAGLGEECARQLALKPAITRIILGCRSEERATAAKNRLEAKTGKKVFEILIIDLSKPDSVRKAVGELKGPVDSLVLNAGGFGGRDHTAISEYGVPSMVAANVTGHVLFLDLLLQQGKLQSAASVIYAGSEAARGVPSLGMPKPVIKEGTVEEFSSYCDGSVYGKKPSAEAMYGGTKLLGALWMADMARQQPGMRFVTISPGGTSGTEVLSDAPTLKRWLANGVMMPMLKLFGMVHSPEKGAQRYVDAMLDENSYHSGIFYASKKGTSGEVVDQATLMPQLQDEEYQKNANAAIHKFVNV